MKIEAGKYYKTRDGQKAYVACLSNPLDLSYCDRPVIGWIGQDFWRWGFDGLISAIGYNACDLIEEWREPRRFTVYVYEQVFGRPGERTTWIRLDREPSSVGHLIAKKEIVEGEGL